MTIFEVKILTLVELFR